MLWFMCVLYLGTVVHMEIVALITLVISYLAIRPTVPTHVEVEVERAEYGEPGHESVVPMDERYDETEPLDYRANANEDYVSGEEEEGEEDWQGIN